MSYDFAALRNRGLIILLAVLLAAVIVSGCGGSDSSPSASLGDGATCGEWNVASQAEKNGYLRSKGQETGQGSVGQALSLWMDSLCGRSGQPTPYSTSSSIGAVFSAAQDKFASGQTLPPGT